MPLDGAIRNWSVQGLLKETNFIKCLLNFLNNMQFIIDLDIGLICRYLLQLSEKKKVKKETE